MTRISTTTVFEQGITSIQQRQLEIAAQQQKLANARRMLTPADDPVAAARVLEVGQSQTINQQYGINGDSAKSSLNNEESMLRSVVNLLQDVRTNALYAGNATLSDNDRKALATDLRSRYQELLSLANSADGNGQYLFSGYKGSTKPFAETSAGTVAYYGDEGQRLLQISASRQIEISDSGSQVFQNVKNGNGTFVAASALNASAAQANTGTGQISAAVLSPPPLNPDWQQPVTITFTGPATFNVTGTGVGLPAVGVAYVAGAPISYNGWTTKITGAPVAGDVFNLAPNSGTGVISAGNVTDPAKWNAAANNKNFAINFAVDSTVTPALTTYDIVDTVSGLSVLTGLAPAAAPYPRTYTPGAAIDFKNQGAEPAFDFGVTLSVNGTPANGDSFAVQPSTNIGIFKILNDLTVALETPVVGTAGTAKLNNSLSAAIPGIDNALERVLTVVAAVGSRLKEADSTRATVDDMAVQYEQTKSQLQGLDYAKAISDLTLQQMSLEAAQKSFAKIQNLSLFNYL